MRIRLTSGPVQVAARICCRHASIRGHPIETGEDMGQQAVLPRQTEGVRAAPALVAYLGWAGRGNLGDDASQLVLESAVPGVASTHLPLYPAEPARFVIAPSGARQIRNAVLLLGGGTVV